MRDVDCLMRLLRCHSTPGDEDEVAEVLLDRWRAAGLQTDAHGIATRGVILRHLVMPNNVAGTDKLVQWIARELSTDTYVNVMQQYRPEHKADEYPEIARSLTEAEWKQALSWARKAGLTNLDT